MTCTWHVRCDQCGNAGIWLTQLDAHTWAATHRCPPQTPRGQREETQPSMTQPERITTP